jgi:hypothetical protein
LEEAGAMTSASDDFEALLRDPEGAADYVREAMTQRTSLALLPGLELERLIASVKQSRSADLTALINYLREEVEARDKG